jgi:hypothetical protein
MFLWSVGVKMSEAGDAQQTQRFVVQGGFFCSMVTSICILQQLLLKK